MFALITTTVNVPENLRAWRAAGMSRDDVVIVVGDRKTPHAEVRDLLKSLRGENVYLHPDDQANWQISDVLGWNTIQRRNIALLEAMRYQPDYIITVDDDNFPVTNDHFDRLEIAFSGASRHALVSTDTGWWNAGTLLDPPVTVRGFPLTQRHVTHTTQHLNQLDSPLRVGVVASLWLGDPDIDAVERIAVDPEIKRLRSDVNIVLNRGTWCPFNTQSTAFRAELAPFMLMWPGVGRYDDIWASFVTQRVMEVLGYNVLFGQPLVQQYRNEHNLLTDLRAELLGMEYTEEVTQVLRGVSLTSDMSPRQLLAACLDAVAPLGWLPKQTSQSFEAWLTDLEEVFDG